MGKFNRRKAIRSLVVVHRTPKSTGLGFFVEDTYIITAAHCLPRMPDRDNPGSDQVMVTVEALNSSMTAKATIVGADSCLDVAILSDTTLNGGDLPKPDRDRLLALLGKLEPARLILDEPPVGSEFPVHIYSHERRWLSGTATLWAPNYHLLDLVFPTPDMCPKPGTSGTPVFDDEGRVVGLVSMAGGRANESGDVVRLAAALPGWMLRQLQQALNHEGTQ